MMDDIPLNELAVSWRLLRCLGSAGVHTLEQLAATTEPQLRSIRGIGSTSVAEAMTLLAGSETQAQVAEQQGFSSQRAQQLMERLRHVRSIRFSGAKLRTARLNNNLTQQQLSIILDVERDVIRRWENDKYQPNATNLLRLLTLLRLRGSDLSRKED